MTTPVSPSPFSEADLHGLVDGRLDSGRQAELARRLKSHPTDRARVTAWREQNELIRATFSEVENEAVPMSLSLAPTPRLRCVASEGLPILPPTSTAMARANRATEAKRRRSRLIALGLATGCAGLLGSWLTMDHGAAGPDKTVEIGQPQNTASPGGGFQPSLAQSEIALATRTRDAMAHLPGVTSKPQGLLASSAPSSNQQTSSLIEKPVKALPVTTIPDLGDLGFSLTNAVTLPVAPATIVFFYDNTRGDRLALGAARTDIGGATQVQAVGDSVLWRHDGRLYALRGLSDIRRLGEVAAFVRSAQETADGAE